MSEEEIDKLVHEMESVVDDILEELKEGIGKLMVYMMAGVEKKIQRRLDKEGGKEK
jgi:hypothetical protein